MTIFLIVTLNLLPAFVTADTLEITLQKIESEWARIHYTVAKKHQEVAFKQLLADIKDVNVLYLDQAELIIQQAIIVASNADNIFPLAALQAIHQARDLLLHAIELNPEASDGAAFVILGSLYYQVPGWPIAYGDDDEAKKMLQKALAINPNTIDANYFYGDFLVTQGRQKDAVVYFKRALAISVRTTQVFADTKLHNQAKFALIKNGQQPSVSKAEFW